MAAKKKLAAGSGSSLVVERCQVCDCPDLEPVLFIGYIPPVNQMPPVGQRPHEQPAYPAEVLFCPNCKLVQLGCIDDPAVLFAPDYPYTSGTTRILHENFAEMVCDCKQNVLDPGPNGLVVVNPTQPRVPYIRRAESSPFLLRPASQSTSGGSVSGRLPRSAGQ